MLGEWGDGVLFWKAQAGADLAAFIWPGGLRDKQQALCRDQLRAPGACRPRHQSMSELEPWQLVLRDVEPIPECIARFPEHRPQPARPSAS